MQRIRILGIETSCDETAASVVENGREVLSNIVSSQIDIHARFGGVVPEVASRNHTLAINTVIDNALLSANLTLKDIDAIAVTYGAGLQGALLVGISTAKAISYMHNLPLIAVNHIKGHIAANYITNKELNPPYLCLIVSGGHTQIVMVNDYTNFSVLGGTVDDAVGEAFDKVARVLGLGYPGGIKVDKLAQKGENNLNFPLVMQKEDNFNFSYSGLKTAVINYLHNCKQSKKDYKIEDVCASFQCSAIDILVEKTLKASKKYNMQKIAIAGGVSANSYLRKKLEKLKEQNYQIFMPSIDLCTDNAAMIASCGYFEYTSGNIADLTLNANSSLR